MGEAKRRKDGLSVVPHSPGQGMRPVTVLVTPGASIEQTGPDGTVYLVQAFNLVNEQGYPLGVNTPAGFVPFSFMAVPIPIRRSVLVPSGVRH